MGLLQRIKNGLGQEHNRQLSIRELADKTRADGEGVKEVLLGIRFVNDKIPDEKLESYRKIVISFVESLDNNVTMAMDTSVIDECLKQMVIMLQEAITNGYQKCIKEIFKGLKKGIDEIRKPISSTDRSEAKWELEQKNATMEQETGILKYMLQLEKIESEIAELKAQIEYGKERYGKVYQKFRKIADERKDLVEALDHIAFKKPSKEIIGEVATLQALKEKVVTIHNSLNQAKEIRAVKEIRCTSILKAIETMKSEILLSQNRLNPRLIELQEKMQRDIEETLLQEKKENARLREIANEFDASLVTYFEDPEIVDEMIETDMNFKRLLEQERQEQEQRLMYEKSQKQFNIPTV